MASTLPTSKSEEQMVETKQDPPPNGAGSILKKSLVVGAGTGIPGLFWGAASGIATSSQILGIRVLASGIEWFGMGAMFYGTRHFILARHGPVESATPAQKIEASTLGVAISRGAILGLSRGPRAIIPSVIVGAGFGGLGQYAVNSWVASRENTAEQPRSSWLDAKWSPMKRLTDGEYEHVLEEKILRIDAEIAIIDDNIAALRAQQDDHMKAAAKATPQTPTSNDSA